MRSLVVVLVASFSVPAAAESSLGISGAALSFGLTEDEAGAHRASTRATVDVAVTDVHGVQGDVLLTETASGTVGSLAAHLYMSPTGARKYGVFAALADLDGKAMTWGALGVEGMVQLGDTSSLELSAGLGAADAGGMDYIFGGVSYARELTANLDLSASLDLVEFDEAALRAVSYDAGLTVTYHPDASPLSAYASVTHSGLTGRDGQTAETRLGLGITFAFGNSGGVSPTSRSFRTPQPMQPLLRRALW